MYTHYSPFTMIAKLRTAFAEVTANRIHDIVSDIYHPILMYRGMSGIALATTVSDAYYNLTRQETGMIYVRKRGEETHSYRTIETSWANPRCLPPRFFFIDDFIEMSGTLIACIDSIGTLYSSFGTTLDSSKVLEQDGIWIILTGDSEILNKPDVPIHQILGLGSAAYTLKAKREQAFSDEKPTH